MDNDIGNANYLESHNMMYGNTLYDEEDTKHNNNLEIYNYTMEEDDEFSKEEKELFIIAKDINEKIQNNYQVFDKKTGKLRNIKYSDICIITDRNKHFDKYKKILEYNEIPSVLYKDEILTNDDDILVLKNLINLVDYVNKNIYDDFTLLVDGKEAFPEIINCINNE
jgi:ATP-dependent exoDNAse (exonuclease V) beta subunit